MTELSGAQWVDRFPTSRNVEDLCPDFHSKVVAFLAALDKAGASVYISATYRPPERAYLMHWAWQIAHGFPAETADTLGMVGVDIKWDHGTVGDSERAAKAMVDGYGMAYTAVLQSRHTEHRAIDMTISWKGTMHIIDALGNHNEISSLPHSGQNPELIKVGATFGVIKLASDPPHWSDDGH